MNCNPHKEITGNRETPTFSGKSLIVVGVNGYYHCSSESL
jgi:hypothetical protein